MTGRVEGKVALITGAGRGQGRSHAVRLAEEGADIIALDICEDIETNSYPNASVEELEDTVRQVKDLGRRVVSCKTDVRDRRGMQEAITSAVRELGRLDIVVPNAGILPMGPKGPQAFIDAVDVDLLGVINTCSVSIPLMTSGGSIIIIGSVAGLIPGQADNPALGPGGAGYAWAKQSILTYTRALALTTAPQSIRVNAIHPLNVDTILCRNDDLYRLFRPDLENPTLDDCEPVFRAAVALPTMWLEPRDIAHLVLFLGSDEARFLTGLNIRADAGGMLKVPGPSTVL